MAPRTLTCAEIDRDDLDERYLAGRLSDTEAEAFEAHYFECERCWSVVSRGLEVRAAEQAPAVSPVPDARATPAVRAASATRLAPWRWGVLAAAASILVAVALWRSPGDSGTSGTATVRGVADTLHVVAAVDAGAIRAVWPAARGADRYRVRLLTAGATLVVERETADTSVSVPLSSIDDLRRERVVYWDVQALDRLRRVTARSGLVAVQLPAGR